MNKSAENTANGAPLVEKQADSISFVPSFAKQASWIGIRLMWVAMIGTAVLPLLPLDEWWIRIGDFPRVQLLVSYVVGLIIAGVASRWFSVRWWAGLLVVSCGVQLYSIFPYLPVAPVEVEAATSEHAPRLRIVSANVLQKNRDSDRFIELIREAQPHVFAVVEVNHRWIHRLKELDDLYPHQVLYPLENKYGIALYSVHPFVESEVRHFVSEDIPSIDASIRLPSGQVVRLVAIHPNPPRPGEDTTKRDAELILVGREIAECNDTAVVLGDLNDVGWSRTTNLFQEVSGLLDPRKGRGVYPTFHSESLIFRYPLDHLFHTNDFRVVSLKTLKNIGSDHLPLFVELSFEPSAQSSQEAPDLDAGDREDAEDTVDEAKTDAKSKEDLDVSQDDENEQEID